MSISYKWSVTKVQVNPLLNGKTNVVVNVSWVVQAQDGDYKAAAAGTRSLQQSSSHIEFDQLTEQQVLNWCFEPEYEEVLNPDNTTSTVTRLLKDEGEAQVAGQIKRQRNQKAAEPALPWVKIPA
jgi:hypothetical protein